MARAAWLLAVVGLAPIAIATGETAFLVGDARTVDYSGVSGDTETPLALGNGRVVFVNRASAEATLWGTQGTPATTEVLITGPGAAQPVFLGAVEGLGYFLLSDETTLVDEVWRTDGTAAGTWRLATPDGDPFVGNIDPFDGEGRSFLLTESRLVVLGCAGEATACGVWRTDPGGRSLEPVGEVLGAGSGFRLGLASSGARLWWAGYDGERFYLSMLDEGADDAITTVPLEFPVSEGLLEASGAIAYFVSASNEEEELWASDGTPAGTVQVSDFEARFPFPFDAWLAPNPRGVYFVVDDVTHGFELWESDGSGPGTRRVTEFGYANALAEAKREDVFFLEGRYLFRATDGLDLRGLWSAQEPSSPPVFLGEADWLGSTGERIVFASIEGVRATVGTPESTELLYPCPCPFLVVGGLALHSETVFFPVGSVLWRTDGHPAGTAPAAEFPDGFFVTARVAVEGDSTFVVASDALYGSELWRVLAGSAPTLVSDVWRPAASSNPDLLTALGEIVLFSADRDAGKAVLSGDARAPMLRPLLGPPLSYPGAESFVVSGGVGYFVVCCTYGIELWRTDGSGDPPGTYQLLDIENGAITYPVAVGGGLAFFVRQQEEVAIWLSDGTVNGTIAAAPLPGFLYLLSATSVGNRVVFVGATSDDRLELWSFDTSTSGTAKLLDVTDFGSSTAGPWFALADRAYLPLAPIVLSGDSGFLRTDGTTAGTRLVRGAPEPQSSLVTPPLEMVQLHDDSYYTQLASGPGAPPQPERVEIWRLAGDTEQLVRVHTVRAVRTSPYELPRGELASNGAALFFVGGDDEHGAELWKSEGTPGSERMVEDLWPGSGSALPGELVAAEGIVFFAADDGVHGRELFQSDGSTAGTRLAHDVWPGLLSAAPAKLTTADGYLYFTAEDGLSGRELWALPLGGGEGCAGGPPSLCLGAGSEGRFRVEAVWRDFEGKSGRGEPAELTADTGYFWFFDDANVEIVVKVLDARAINDHFWVYSGALSNVEYHLTVTDTETGSTVRYFNPAGVFGSFGDVEALSPALDHTAATKTPSGGNGRVPSASSWSSGLVGPCAPGPERLCLGGERFAVEIAWSDGRGATGNAQAVPLTGDTGSFWFFDPANVEVVLKVLDGTAINGKFWVFYGALSDVEYTVRVTDTLTGAVREYRNPLGRFASAGDTEAF